MPEITKLSVTSESDAWELLEKALSKGLPKGTIQLELGDWYNFHVKFNGEQYNSTITPSLMKTFIDLQKMVYRTYAILNYGQANKRLTDAEKKSLEIHVKVSPGSSEIEAIIKNAIESLVKGAINEMEAQHYVIIILALILCTAGNIAWKSYLKHRSDLKNADLHLDLSREESKRLDIFAEALKYEPYIEVIKNDSDEFRNSVIKCAKNSDTVSIANQVITHEQADKLARTSRTQSEEVRLDGEYRITKVDSKDPDMFKIYLVGNGFKEFPAVLDSKAIISGINWELIREAEWEKKMIRLNINGTMLRGDVTSATIIDVPDRYSPTT